MQFGQKGNLVARLATSSNELDAAQQLRYQVFYQELSAIASADTLANGRDCDQFDEVCDHLLVVRQSPDLPSDKAPNTISVEGGELVGTYRLLRQQTAQQSIGFYSQHAFDLAPLIASKPELKFLELGRSCVRKEFRTRPVMELLWQGIWNYLRFHQHDVMIGCASLEGTDTQALSLPLSFLHYNFSPPEDWSVQAHRQNAAEINLMAPETINHRAAIKSLPTLIKAYLRLGAYIAQGAVLDSQFNTTDVLIILPVSAINPRYFSHFGQPNKKTANSNIGTGG